MEKCLEIFLKCRPGAKEHLRVIENGRGHVNTAISEQLYDAVICMPKVVKKDTHIPNVSSEAGQEKDDNVVA